MALSNGTTVRVHYTGTLADGAVFDSSRGREPLEFTLGEGMLLPGFEEAVRDLDSGGSVAVTIPAGEAYGEYSEEMVMVVPLSRVPPNITLEAGQQLRLMNEHSELDATISEVTAEHIVLDANHPLAGKDLTFAIELVEVL